MAHTVVRDAIWGDVRLGPRELAVVDTPAFQRLRRVRQLGFTHLVFPGAHHTRFEHSIGVHHLAGLAFERLAALPGTPHLDDEARSAFACAALLHDVGHYPFSHAVEELEVEQIRRHEDVARELILSGDLGRVIAREWGVAPERVADFVAGPRGPSRVEADPLLRTVLDSSLDVDKLDYLVRDAHGANVPYGVVDVQRLIGSLTVWRDPEGRPALAVEEKGLGALQSLVFAKHLMFSTVYWHHACRSAVVMLLRALQEALETEALGAPELERSGDEELCARLAADGMPPATRTIATRIAHRRLYKRGFEVGPDHPAFDRLERLWFRPSDRKAIEDAWSLALGADPAAVLIDIPEPKRITVDLPVVPANGEPEPWDRVSGLGSADLDRFQRTARRIRAFASDRELAGRLASARDELLG